MRCWRACLPRNFTAAVRSTRASTRRSLSLNVPVFQDASPAGKSESSEAEKFQVTSIINKWITRDGKTIAGAFGEMEDLVNEYRLATSLEEKRSTRLAHLAPLVPR